MPDPLHVKLVSESAAGLASASFSPPGATRNGVHFACVIYCEMLRFPAFWKISAGLILVASQSSATTCIHVSLDSRGQRSWT